MCACVCVFVCIENRSGVAWACLCLHACERSHVCKRGRDSALIVCACVCVYACV